MSDFDDRLAALDPAAAQPYRHPDLEGMITRITSQRVKPRPVWRRFQMKVAGALAASALLTLGAIAALEGAGTVLPLLALPSAGTGTSPGTAKPIFGTMEVSATYHFSAGPGFAALTPTGLSYRLQVPRDVAGEALRVAAVFGVTRSPLTIGGGARHETITDSSGRSLDYQGAGLARWDYSWTPPLVASPVTSNASSAKLPSHATLEGDVRGSLARLGYGYTVSSPNFSTSSISTTNANGPGPVAIPVETLAYTVDVDGMATDQSVVFSVETGNHVVAASGPAFRVASRSPYPLRSPAEGLRALNAGPVSGSPARSSAGTSTSGSAPNAAAGSAASTSPTGTTRLDVSVTSVSVSLATYRLTDGTVWLLPVYVYAGHFELAHGVAAHGAWSELAVSPRYARVRAPANASGTPGSG